MPALDSEVVQGLDGLLESMEGLPLVVQRKLIADALREGADVVAIEAEARAPVETGRLSENIVYAITEQTASGAVANIGPAKQVFYGAFVERGTEHMTPEPFLGPAFDDSVDKATAVIQEVLGDGIEAAWIG